MKAKRPFPLKFYIQGAVWKVKFKAILKDEADEACRGLTDPQKKIIYLERSLKGKELEWIFWHEYMHAVLAESGVVGNTGGLDTLVEEIICDNLANAMTRDKRIKWKRLRNVLPSK